MAADLNGAVDVKDGEGDVVIVVSGCKVDDDRFLEWLAADGR